MMISGNTINLRNDLYQYQDGLFMISIPLFNEAVIREAILNAISHRDYRFAGSELHKAVKLTRKWLEAKA